MTDAFAFLLAALALLAVPGPTNTLLATSGAAVGFRRSLPLIPAEMTGYAASITTLALVVGPLVARHPTVGLGLKVACGLYLARLACRLWCGGGLADGLVDGHPAAPVTFGHVLLTTVLNPKGVVFAFAILPHLAEGRAAEAAPYGLALAGLIAVVATGWISLGAAAKRGFGARLHPLAARRCGAAAMVAFALILSGSALAALL